MGYTKIRLKTVLYKAVTFDIKNYFTDIEDLINKTSHMV